MAATSDELLARVGATWESLAQQDPLWAVLSAPERKGGKWNLDEFFATGKNEIETLLAQLDRHAISYHPEKALDFGCGIGRLTQALAPHFREVCGVDVAPSMISMAEANNRYPNNCRYILNQSPDLRAFGDGEFSFVLSSIVLQHQPVPLAYSYLTEFARILRPDGLAVFQVPARFIQEKVLLSKAFNARISCPARDLRLPARSTLSLKVTLENASAIAWDYNEPFVLSLGNHWLRTDGSVMIWDDGRTRLPGSMQPGASADLELSVKAPEEPGSYKLELDIVQEGVAWFAEKGSHSVQLDVIVETARESGETIPLAQAPQSCVPHFEMNCIPRVDIISLLERLNCRLEFIEPSHAGGIGTLSYYYYARKRPGSPFASG